MKFVITARYECGVCGVEADVEVEMEQEWDDQGYRTDKLRLKADPELPEGWTKRLYSPRCPECSS